MNSVNLRITVRETERRSDLYEEWKRRVNNVTFTTNVAILFEIKY